MKPICIRPPFKLVSVGGARGLKILGRSGEGVNKTQTQSGRTDYGAQMGAGHPPPQNTGHHSAGGGKKQRRRGPGNSGIREATAGTELLSGAL